MDDRFASWANDDLLATPAAAEAFAARFPKLAPVFCWPSLNALFEKHNKAAAATRRRSRLFGMWAVGIGYAGLLLAALTPIVVIGTDWADDVVTRLLGALTAFMALASGLMAYSQLLLGRDKSVWLLQRFRCERIRQFHFQLILARVGEVVSAMRSDAGKAAFLEVREKDLTAFVYYQIDNAPEMMHYLENDTAEDRPWMFREWAEEPVLADEASPELAELLDVLGQQRFGIQLRFTTLKLKPGIASPATRSAAIAQASNLLTMLLLLIGLATGVTFMVGQAPTSATIVTLAAAGGLASATIAAMRVVSDGLQLTADTERYRWYLATLKSLNRRFEVATPGEALARLRDLERLTYQEMRRFIVSVTRSKFVI